MLKTRNNEVIVAALAAVARSYSRYPGFQWSKAAELATRLDTACATETGYHVVVALVILLLKGIGIRDAADPSRLLRD